MTKFNTYEQLNLPKIASEIEAFWKQEQVFKKSVEQRQGAPSFVFYEGPPSANGMPGIHHVMARAIKDIFCRYKTQKGYQVLRKAGWDTHGLPIELGVEKALGITKEDIGTKISIAEYNEKCRQSVMQYTDHWNTLTEKVGYWVDMQDPYITYENTYIESVWWLLGDLYKKNLLYKGYTIQPYSPAAGTGLSSHELNQPGCYKEVKDTTVVAQFKLVDTPQKTALLGSDPVHVLAWTTTPWTLPSNTALTVGAHIEYVVVKTINPYSNVVVRVLLAKNLLGKYLFEFKAYELNGLTPIERSEESNDINILRNLKSGDVFPESRKPYHVYIVEDRIFKGADLVGLRYDQLMPLAQPAQQAGNAFQIIAGDFVTTEDGTGIVHTAPTFGADDAAVAKKAGVPGMLVEDATGKLVPLVDLQGRFIAGLDWLSGKFVKNEYYPQGTEPEKSVDVEIAIWLKEQNKAFKVEKYAHNYPHCWRTDKPVLYYPLDAWFIKTTAVKDKMIAGNAQIQWKPASTGSGRFGNWLENLQDWNLSRSRYWGIPIPIWTSEDKSEQRCIESLEALYKACAESVAAGIMHKNPLEGFEVGNFSKENYQKIDLHRPFVDDIVLVSPSGKPLYREADLIDVWFDSGAMPYAQLHYPFENKALIDENKAFPADFIAEGVDQTRGWFFTLHAIATMCFDSIAYKNVISNGLVLDKNGQKMSKRLGNAVDPFETIATYGPDATRFYMITNAQPWDNLKFDVEGIAEVQRKFFRALHNTYAFFALYANVDGFSYEQEPVSNQDLQEIDHWILSRVNTLIQEVDAYYEQYEPTKAGRAIQDFVVDDLSNWYVRLGRKRFWKGTYTTDKIAAYQTLYTCLETVAKIIAPIAPFYAERVFLDLNNCTKKSKAVSVHTTDFPKADPSKIDADLERRMYLAQKISSMILAIRKKEKLRVRQPLQKMMVPALNAQMKAQIERVQNLILTEVNVKELEIISPTSDIFTKTIKPDFKMLGPKFSKDMKAVAAAVQAFSQEQIAALETTGTATITLNGQPAQILLEDVVIATQDIPGWQVVSEGGITVALDLTLSEALISEGIARELVNRIQNFRKDQGFEVTDRIAITLESNAQIDKAVHQNLDYICSETLTNSFEILPKIESKKALLVELDEQLATQIHIELSAG